MVQLRACWWRMAQSQALKALYDAAVSRAATMPVLPCSPTSQHWASRHSSSSCIGANSCGTTRWLSAETASDVLGEVGTAASYLARNCRARQATQTAIMSKNYSSCSSDAAERVEKMVEGGAWQTSCSWMDVCGRSGFLAFHASFSISTLYSYKKQSWWWWCACHPTI